MPTYDARDLDLNLDKKELRALYKTQSHRHGMAIAFNWILIGLTIFACIQLFDPFQWYHVFIYIPAILIIGARQHALTVLMHDAAHYRFLKNKKLNDLITDITCMWPIFSTIEKYRQNHLRHHRHLNTEDDPDWAAKLTKREFKFPKTRQQFMIGLLSYFTLYQGLMDAIWFLKRFDPPKANKKAKGIQEKLPRLSFYLIIAATLTLTGTWGYFFIYWFFPYLSTFFMFQYIRSVAEHFGDLDYDHLLNATRSVKVNPIERFFFAPHHVGYHIEHHLYPGVPFYNLPQLHDMLMAMPEYKDKAHITHGFLRGLFHDLSGDHKQVAAVETAY